MGGGFTRVILSVVDPSLDGDMGWLVKWGDNF